MWLKHIKMRVIGMESLFVFTTMAVVNSKYINYRSLK